MNPGSIKMPGLLLTPELCTVGLFAQTACISDGFLHPRLHLHPCISAPIALLILPKIYWDPPILKVNTFIDISSQKCFTKLAPSSLPPLSPLLLPCVCSPILTSFALSMSKPIFLLQFASSCSHFRINKSLVEGNHLDAISLKFFFFFNQKIP